MHQLPSCSLECRGNSFGSIISVGGLKFVPTGVWRDDGVDLLVGPHCQVELLPATVYKEFWFEDLTVPRFMPLQLCMLNIPVHCYPYGTVFIFIEEVKAGWTRLHKLFLLPRSPLVGFLDRWCYHCVYLIIRGNAMMVGVSKLNDDIY